MGVRGRDAEVQVAAVGDAEEVLPSGQWVCTVWVMIEIPVEAHNTNSAALAALTRETNCVKKELEEVKESFEAYKRKTRVATVKLQQKVAEAKEKTEKEELEKKTENETIAKQEEALEAEKKATEKLKEEKAELEEKVKELEEKVKEVEALKERMGEERGVG